eukprot:TRINITY_DN11438_c0_g1_i1.p1 TRINITY_DN11438_c0_g1~~TRINITY_DN11438_c0_g1_i1.p1  ORF type:complete len:217 (-),score=41.72 TRINITY_DN11438_c0_g1_i1:142-792(-)
MCIRDSSYSGTAIIVNLTYYFLSQKHSMQSIQILAYILLTFHYGKRVLESVFVHRVSYVMVSFAECVVELAYYWGFGAPVVSYSIFSSAYSKPGYFHPAVPYVLTAVFFCFEYMNLRCHMVLRSLRPEGTNKRGIPSGYGFDWVSCAHYFWEFCSWAAFASIFRTIPSILFCVGGLGAMTVMAIPRHRGYHEYFDGKKGKDKYPANRKVIIPFLFC